MEVLRHLRTRRHVGIDMRAVITAILAFSLAACAAPQQAGPLRPAATGPKWPIKTREHVDTWLHAFALLQDDTSLVPLFARGYRDRAVVAKNARNVTTELDKARTELARVLAEKPAMLNAQFIPLYFGSWDEMAKGFDYFQRAQGDPRSANNPDVAQIIAFYAQQFPTAADREFAKKLFAAIQSERDLFHHAWWVEEQRARGAALAAADSLWQSRWRPALQRFLDHTQQGDGNLIPTLALGGEGRAVPVSKQLNEYAVTWPSTPDSAAVLLYAFAHEASGVIVNVAVNDNLTPVQQRAGLGARYSSVGLVRGGLLLVEKVDPALAEGYARWYLRLAGKPVPASNARAALAAAFPMPEEIITSMRRQIDVAIGGI